MGACQGSHSLRSAPITTPHSSARLNNMQSIKDQDPPKALLTRHISLLETDRDGKIFPVTTLDKWWHGWRIRHPRAESHDENMPSFPETSATAPGIYPVSGHGSGAKENAPAAPLHRGALSCGYPIRHRLTHDGNHPHDQIGRAHV